MKNTGKTMTDIEKTGTIYILHYGTGEVEGYYLNKITAERDQRKLESVGVSTYVKAAHINLYNAGIKENSTIRGI